MNKLSTAADNAALLERVRCGDAAAEEELMRANMGLVRSVAARFVGRGQEKEDLEQIGCIGMLKAIRGYDKSYGTAFSTYAVPLIMGEIKRFLRDDGLIKVGREAKRNYVQLSQAKERFFKEHGREARLSELCAVCGMDEETAVYAMEACSGAISLEEKIGGEDGVRVEELCGDAGLGCLDEKIALQQAIDRLTEREKTIIYMRYYKGLTQNDVAKRLGVTQVKISRDESKIREKLRKELKCG